MKNNRRDFLRFAGMAGLTVTGGGLFAGIGRIGEQLHPGQEAGIIHQTAEDMSIIGQYGPWAASLTEGRLPSLSFRRGEAGNIDAWRQAARSRTMDRMGIPDLGPVPKVTIKRQADYDGVHIEEMSWQLPYGRPTEAILLKPSGATGPLPAILAFHDHGGNKYFGVRKITRTDETQHPLMVTHQHDYYEGRAWANEIAKRGYVVLIHDAFTFASRRVMMADVPEIIRDGLTDADPENAERINAYNAWAGRHEHIMAKSLFSAGTTWPGVFFAEDRVALDILCARQDVDASRVGCGGLSGGGLRTVMMGGLEPRIKCAVCVGFMTTWRDFLLNKSFTHTWMAYVPLLPNELDFPEILGLRVPLPAMVLNDSDDFLYTLPEMRRAEKILDDVYKKAGAGDHFKCSYYPGPHKFDARMQAEAFGWFDKWLK